MFAVTLLLCVIIVSLICYEHDLLALMYNVFKKTEISHPSHKKLIQNMVNYWVTIGCILSSFFLPRDVYRSGQFIDGLITENKKGTKRICFH